MPYTEVNMRTCLARRRSAIFYHACSLTTLPLRLRANFDVLGYHPPYTTPARGHPGATSTPTESQICVPTGWGDGNCNETGCCDVFVSCNSDGTCSVPDPACDAHSCGAGMVCVGGNVCEPLDATVSLSGINDPGSPFMGVLSCDHKPDVFLIGDK